MSPGLWLALNAGSSSIKLAIYRLSHAQLALVARGHLDLRLQPLRLQLAHGGQHSELALQAPVTDTLDEVLEALLAQLESHEALGELAGAGHRVVHGGLRFRGPARVDDAVLAELEALVPLAPLHQAHSLKLVRALRRLRPQLPQTVSFDTVFHARQDDLMRRFALPRALHEQGVRRYGFHGLSYAYIAAELARRHPAQAAGRVVAAHLGSGASLCAMRAGQSVDSSMGFSTLDGVPMATRCGALDAGVVLYLQRALGLSLADVEDLLYHRSGLLGVSGLSADMRSLEASHEAAAREALQLFALRCAGEVARLAGSLQGLDALVFTAGIGEHDAHLRALVCARLAWLGVVLDEAANLTHAERISHEGSGVAVYVIPTDEERMIAEEARALLAGG